MLLFVYDLLWVLFFAIHCPSSGSSISDSALQKSEILILLKLVREGTYDLPIYLIVLNTTWVLLE